MSQSYRYGGAGTVYFARPVGAEGPVKIGCSRLPHERLKQLLPWSPLELEIVAQIPGNEDLEQRFHHRFLAQHMHGEWFRTAPSLTATIAQIADGIFDISALPAPKRLPARRNMDSKYCADLSLSLRFGYRAHNIGLVAPAECTHACNSLRKLRGAEHAAAVGLLERYIETGFLTAQRGSSAFQRNRLRFFLRRHPQHQANFADVSLASEAA